MAERARVTAIGALTEFRGALAKFIEDARSALSEVDAEVDRTMFWVERAQRGHWEKEIRRREDAVGHAKSAYYRKQMQDGLGPASVVDERKAIDAARRRVDEARDKLAATRSWALQLSRDTVLYKGQVQRLSTMLGDELPRAVAVLGTMTERLDEYVRMAAPSADGGIKLATSSDEKGGLASAGGTASRGPRESGGAGAAWALELRRRTPGAAERQRVLAQTPIDEAADGVLLPEGLEWLAERLAGRGVVAGAGGEVGRWGGIRGGQMVVVASGVLSARDVYLERIEGVEERDSGWYVGPVGYVSAEPMHEAVAAAWLVRRRPELGAVLMLGVGMLALVRGKEVEAVVDGTGQVVWPREADDGEVQDEGRPNES